MGLTRCRDCGRKISDTAAACPHCGRAVSEAERAHAQRATAVNTKVKLGALGAVVVIVLLRNIMSPGGGSSSTSTLVRPSAPDASPSATTSSLDGPSTPPSEYKSLLANVWTDQPLYLRTDTTYVGTVAGVEDDHRFADGSVRDGVLVKFADGSLDWIPRRTLQQIYMTK